MPALKLIKKEEISGNIYSFSFQNINSLKWHAGQFLQILIPHQNPDDRGVKRFFTIASAPFEEIIMITTRIETENSSSFKKAMINLRAGDIVECNEPQGKFIVEPEDLTKKIVFIAGGIGITPIRSILLDINHKKESFKADLLYANRDDDLPFKKDLQNVENLNENFKIYYFIQPKFIVKEELDKLYKDYRDINFYLSGPINMIKAIANILYEKDISKDNIRTDYFPGYD